ncbi:hypothetical protein [Fusobacterium sp.]|uniref:hypothetical protein n=1 Tax=Fusobacterium sp. TaxID=68766 RepID=UPI00396C441D
MNKNLNEIDKKVIKFLLTSGVYSELAIIKNLGITYEELEEIYAKLEQYGYLEKYSQYAERENEKSCSCTKNCNGCSSGNKNSCNSCRNTDYSNVKVITWKAIEEFSE